MRSYHLTQEQSLKLLVGLPIEYSKSDDGTLITILGADSLQAFANAVLDKVLGEPVAYEYFDENADYHLTNEEPPEYVTATNLTPLYAPKELT